MSTPFAMVGDPDAGLCVDGVCAAPGSPDHASEATAVPAGDAVEPVEGARA